MYSWFRKKPPVEKLALPVEKLALPVEPPPRPKSSMGEPAAQKPRPEFVKGKIAFSSDRHSWEEEFDVVDVAAKVLTKEGFFATRTDNMPTLDTSEYTIRPVIVSLIPLEAGKGAQTCTVVRIGHPQLVAGDFYEFKHSVGSTLDQALTKGFESWVKTDLVPLLDALEEKPQRCATLQINLPEEDGRPARKRRVILGPVAQVQKNKPAPTVEPQQHPFCGCCLLTNSMQAFMPTIEADGFFGVRMFAACNEDGSVSADCRINGQEFEPGNAALRSYVGKWPGIGFEFRKQYVVVQNAPDPNRLP